MSTLQVANVHFNSGGSTRIESPSGNSIALIVNSANSAFLDAAGLTIRGNITVTGSVQSNVSQGWSFIERLEASAGATFLQTSNIAAYRQVRFTIDTYVPTTNTGAVGNVIKFSNDGGNVFANANIGKYQYQYMNTTNTLDSGQGSSTTDSGGAYSLGFWTVSNVAGKGGLSGVVTFSNLRGPTGNTIIKGDYVYTSSESPNFMYHERLMGVAAKTGITNIMLSNRNNINLASCIIIVEGMM